MPRGYVYVIENTLNGKVYVGKTTQPQLRWGNHLTYARNGSSKGHMYRAIRKHGESAFSYQIVEEHDTETDASEAEVFLIAYLRGLGACLYNVTAGGEGLTGFVRSPELRKLCAERCGPGMKVAWQKPDVRARIIAGMKRAWDDKDEYARRIDIKNKSTSAPEIRKKMSDKAKQTWANPESRAKLMERNASQESRDAKGKASLARWSDPTRRAQMLASFMEPNVLAAKVLPFRRRWAKYRRDNGLPPKPGDDELLMGFPLPRAT